MCEYINMCNDTVAKCNTRFCEQNQMHEMKKQGGGGGGGDASTRVVVNMFRVWVKKWI